MFQIWGIQLPKPILLLLAGEIILLFLSIHISMGLSADSIMPQQNNLLSTPNAMFATVFLFLLLLPARKP